MQNKGSSRYRSIGTYICKCLGLVKHLDYVYLLRKSTEVYQVNCWTKTCILRIVLAEVLPIDPLLFGLALLLQGLVMLARVNRVNIILSMTSFGSGGGYDSRVWGDYVLCDGFNLALKSTLVYRLTEKRSIERQVCADVRWESMEVLADQLQSTGYQKLPCTTQWFQPYDIGANGKLARIL